MNRKAILIFITLLFTLALSACGSSSGGGGGGAPGNQPTNLDPSFGVNGKVTTEFFIGNDAYGFDMAVRSDGKIVVAGYANNGTDTDFALARYNTDGTLDITFNNLLGCLPTDICNGKLITDFSSGSDVARGIVIQSDNKIVVVGSARNSSGKDDFALARYNANGTLDTTFGSAGTGKVTTPFYVGQSALARAVALQADGKIMVMGYASASPGNDNFAIARYNTNGTLDTSFNFQFICIIGIPCNGLIAIDFNGGSDRAEAMVMQPDGKIVVAGSALNGTNNDFGLARLYSNGSLDVSFGSPGTGKVTTPFYLGQHDQALAMVLQSNGKIVLAGSARASSSGFNDFALARYNADGTLDTSFNTQPFCAIGGTCSGQVVTEFDSSGWSYANAVTIDGDGKIIAAGSALFGADDYFALARYNTDGSLNTGFGPTGTGRVATNFGDFDSVYAIAVLSDTRIVAAGGTRNATNYTFALARYLP